MKLLFDQNLSHRLCRILAEAFPESAQAKTLNLDRAVDEAIWDFALREGFTIVTMDADFAEIATLRGAPPKVVWLRCGNQPTSIIAQILLRHAQTILPFDADPEAACLELY